MKKNNPQPKQLMEDVKKLIETHGGIRPTARAFNLSPSYVSYIAKGTRPIPESLAYHVGWRLITMWEKK